MDKIPIQKNLKAPDSASDRIERMRAKAQNVTKPKKVKRTDPLDVPMELIEEVHIDGEDISLILK